MKTHIKILLFILCFTFVACPEKKHKHKESIENNQMNFTKLNLENKLGITIGIPEQFKEINYPEIDLLSSKYHFFSIEELYTHLTIEKFEPNEQVFNKFTINAKDNLQLLNSYYIEKRSKTIENAQISEPKKLTQKTGLIQTILNEDNGFFDNYQYLIATIYHKGNFYVIQLISSNQTTPYLYDDFLNIINSIQ